MAEKQELDIAIAADGTVAINVQGAKGKGCLDLTRELEESLGVVLDREIKAVFYEEEGAGAVIIQGERGG